jgi:hypothetical protein
MSFSRLSCLSSMTGPSPLMAFIAESTEEGCNAMNVALKERGSFLLLAAHCSNGCLRQKPRESPFQFSKAFDLLYMDDICTRNYDRGKAQQIRNHNPMCRKADKTCLCDSRGDRRRGADDAFLCKLRSRTCRGKTFRCNAETAWGTRDPEPVT